MNQERSTFIWNIHCPRHSNYSFLACHHVCLVSPKIVLSCASMKILPDIGSITRTQPSVAIHRNFDKRHGRHTVTRDKINRQHLFVDDTRLSVRGFPIDELDAVV